MTRLHANPWIECNGGRREHNWMNKMVCFFPFAVDEKQAIEKERRDNSQPDDMGIKEVWEVGWKVSKRGRCRGRYKNTIRMQKVSLVEEFSRRMLVGSSLSLSLLLRQDKVEKWYGEECS